MKPTVLITTGDPAGIGPEVTVKALKDRRVLSFIRPVLIGGRPALLRAGWTERLAPLIDLSKERDVMPGRPCAEGGRQSLEAVKLAVKLLKKGLGQALVTAPVNKEAWHMAGSPYTGHTELLRDLCGNDRSVMLFVSGKIVCATVTEHYALADVSKNLSKGKIVSRALCLASALQDMGRKGGTIGICALNPHAGDGGLLGREERRIIAPAVKTLRGMGIDAEGPVPSDAAWERHMAGRYAALLCMYHDQALVPLKTLATEPAVHWTAGLPFPRTSPAHGTAYDIADKKKADPAGMKAALMFAARLPSK